MNSLQYLAESNYGETTRNKDCKPMSELKWKALALNLYSFKYIGPTIAGSY